MTKLFKYSPTIALEISQGQNEAATIKDDNDLKHGLIRIQHYGKESGYTDFEFLALLGAMTEFYNENS